MIGTFILDPVLVTAGVRACDPVAMEQLWHAIRRCCWRPLDARGSYRAGQDWEDRVNDCFVIVVSAVQAGKVREPERLMGYIATVIKCRRALMIDALVRERNSSVTEDEIHPIASAARNPEQEAIDRQRRLIVNQALASAQPRDREVLSRFYLEGQTWQRICAEMGLTYNQFRLFKSRAKAKVAVHGQRLMAGKL